MPKKQPEYRENRSHLDFLDKIVNHMDDQVMFEQRLLDSVGYVYDVEEVDIDDVLKLVEDAEESCPEKEKKLLIRTNVLDEGDY